MYKRQGYNLFLNLCNDINIERADLICGSDIKYTYLQDSTGKNSIIDHIFVSSRLVNDISEYTACESIVNLSDHLPVACNLAVPVQMIDTKSIHDTKSTHEQKGRSVASASFGGVHDGGGGAGLLVPAVTSTITSPPSQFANHSWPATSKGALGVRTVRPSSPPSVPASGR